MYIYGNKMSFDLSEKLRFVIPSYCALYFVWTTQLWTFYAFYVICLNCFLISKPRWQIQTDRSWPCDPQTLTLSFWLPSVVFHSIACQLLVTEAIF